MTEAEVIEKCRKLSALESGSTFDGERKSAARMRKRLMRRHGLKADALKEKKTTTKPATSRRQKRRAMTEDELADIAAKFAASVLARLFGRDFVSEMKFNLWR